MRTIYKIASTLLLTVTLTASLIACSGSATSGGNTQSVVIGASIPVTGQLGTFGTVLQLGYTRAVNEINAHGGLDIKGTKYKVQLVTLDNKSDPATASEQARTLFLKNNAVALLGAATPQLNIPIANVAEQLKRPVIEAITPIQAWLGGRTGGWTYAWNTFFDESQSTNLEFETSSLLKTNKRVALFTDTEEDGITMGSIWESKAPSYGYQIAYHAKFPVGTTNFSTQIAAAQAAHADVLITQMVTPDATALWKQMKAMNYQPKAAFCEKCANTSAWPQLLGSTAEGTMHISPWDPTQGFPDANTFVTAYKSQYKTADIAIIVYAYSAARIALDAINHAQSLDPGAINTALGQTNSTYPIGPIHFGANHAAAVPSVEEQWQKGQDVRVFPQVSGSGTIETPVTGLG